MSKTQITTVESKQLVCVILDIHLWSGRQAIKREHLVAASGASIHDLPPKDLASMGSVKICDPKRVQIFARLKNQAINILEENGLPILGAIGIPADRFDEVDAKLRTVGQEFNLEASNLLKDYDTVVTAWRKSWSDQNPGNEHLLSRIPDAQSVFGKLSFDFHAFAISPPMAVGEGVANRAFAKQISGLKGALLEDARVEASDLMTKYLVSNENGVVKPREYITQKTLRPLKRILEKMRSFMFVDPSIGPLADMVEATIVALPKEGQVSGAGLMSIWAMTKLLSDPHQTARVAEAAQCLGVEMAMDQFVSRAQPAPAFPAEIVENPAGYKVDTEQSITQVEKTEHSSIETTVATSLLPLSVPNGAAFTTASSYL
jgi:hypothetical protein